MEGREILNEFQSKQKINRIAIQIVEENYDAEVLYLVGINSRGHMIATILKQILDAKFPQKSFLVGHLRVPNRSVDFTEISIDEEYLEKCRDQNVIIIDDVANSGKTLFYALKPFYDFVPKKLQIAVLVDRKHKSFPIQPDFVGYSLVTTLRNHIHVEFISDQDARVVLH